MPHPAAKQQDPIVATDVHIVQGTPTKMPFAGILDGNLSPDVLIEHRWAAMVESTATNTPAHKPACWWRCSPPWPPTGAR